MKKYIRSKNGTKTNITIPQGFQIPVSISGTKPRLNDEMSLASVTTKMKNIPTTEKPITGTRVLS